jgi:hypothetical protein
MSPLIMSPKPPQAQDTHPGWSPLDSGMGGDRCPETHHAGTANRPARGT